MAEHAGPRQLRRLIDAVMSVAADLDLPVVLERIVRAATELVDARYGALGVLDPTGTYLAEFITVGLDDEHRARIGALPKGHGILGLLIADPRPIRLPDLREHPDSYGFPPAHPPMTSFLGVPLYVHGEVFGNLYLTDKRGGDGFSDIDEELASSLAAAAAVAIENARLHERLQLASLVADRERIGHGLHAAVVQRLLGTSFAMQGTCHLVDRPEALDRLQQHIDDIDTAIRELRSTVFELDIAREPGRSFRRELLDLVADAATFLPFEPSLQLAGDLDRRVPDAVAAHALGALREALTEAARHDAVASIDVAVRADGDLSIEVGDDGHRPADSAADAAAVVPGAVASAAELGGSADIGPAAAGGSVVRWVVPLPA